MWRAAALALLLAAPAAAQEALPPGYPPKIGEIGGTLGGQPVAWETFDFSIGAFDASAWFDHVDGIVLSLVGYLPGEPEGQTGRLLVRARFDGWPAAGQAAAGVTVEIFDFEMDDPRLTSEGRAAELLLDSVAYDDGPGSGYGSAGGVIRAELCGVDGNDSPCRPFEARFQTLLQYSGL